MARLPDVSVHVEDSQSVRRPRSYPAGAGALTLTGVDQLALPDVTSYVVPGMLAGAMMACRTLQVVEQCQGLPPLCWRSGALPTEPGGPQLLAGAMGPKSIARCAQWADGLYAWSANGEQEELARAFAMADEAWDRAGRDHKPYRMGGFWYTLSDGGQQTLYDYVYEYLALAGPEIATWMAESVHRSSADAVSAALDDAEAAGCEELFLVPATAEMAEIDRLGDLLARRA